MRVGEGALIRVTDISRGWHRCIGIKYMTFVQIHFLQTNEGSQLFRAWQLLSSNNSCVNLHDGYGTSCSHKPRTYLGGWADGGEIDK